MDDKFDTLYKGILKLCDDSGADLMMATTACLGAGEANLNVLMALSDEKGKRAVQGVAAQFVERFQMYADGIDPLQADEDNDEDDKRN